MTIVEELLESDDSEDLEEAAMSLNHRKNQLKREHREELRDYELTLNKLIESASPNGNKVDIEVAGKAINKLKREGNLKKETKDKLREGNWREKTKKNFPSSREEIRDEIQSNDAITDDLVHGVRAIEGYRELLEVVESDKMLFDVVLREESREKFDEWAAQQKDDLEGYKATLVEEAEKAGLEKDIKFLRMEEEKADIDQPNEEPLEEIEAHNPPRIVYKDFAVNLMEMYFNEIEKYEQMENQSRSTHERDEESKSTKYVREYDFSILNESYSNSEERVIRNIADLIREEEVSRGDLETAYNWAWTETEDLETPELSRQEKSKLSDVKRSFEKYIRGDEIESSPERRDKPNLEYLLKTGEYMAANGYKTVEVEVKSR